MASYEASFPHRRPYASHVANGGFILQPIPPQRPPLAILRSEGYNSAGFAVRKSSFLAPLDSSTSMQRGQQQLCAAPLQSIQTNRTAQQALEQAELATPIDFAEREYHTSQQDALNAQLRGAVSMRQNAWKGKVEEFRSELSEMQDQRIAFSMLTNDAVRSYLSGYACTEMLAVPPEQVCEDFGLHLSASEVKHIIERKNKSPLSKSVIKKILITLRSSSHCLAPLERYLDELKPVDDYFAVDAAKAAVALHEKLHYSVGTAALRELGKMDAVLEKLEQKVLNAKHQKEDAIDRGDVSSALQNLTHQVDLSNDLVKMNLARMKLVERHAEDVQSMKTSARALIDTAHQIATTMKDTSAQRLPEIQKDIAAVNDDKQRTMRHLDQLVKDGAQRQTEAREKLARLEGEERNLWDQLGDLLSKIEGVVESKAKHVHEELSAHESNNRACRVATELIKATNEHLQNLRLCENDAKNAEKVAENYATFVTEMEEKLQGKLSEAEVDANQRLNNEMRDLVQRYELFTFGAEEARAKRQTYCDILELRHRTALADIATASECLDPNAESYSSKAEGVRVTLGEVKAYIDYVTGLQTDRRSEMEGYLLQIAAEMYQESRQSQSKVATASVACTDSEIIPGAVAGEAVGAALGVGKGEDPTSTFSTQTAGATETNVTLGTVPSLRDHNAFAADSVEIQPAARGPKSQSQRELFLTPVRGADGEWIVHPDDIATAAVARVEVEDAEVPEAAFIHPHLAARELGIVHEEGVLEMVENYVTEQNHSLVSKRDQLARQRRWLERETDWPHTTKQPPVTQLVNHD